MGKVFSGLLAEPQWVSSFSDAVKSIIGPILIVAASAGIIYAIWVGIKFVRAEDKNARDEAKHKLIYVIIGIVVTLVLIALFYWLIWYLSEEGGGLTETQKLIPQTRTPQSGSDASGSGANGLISF